jgi:hypothetical protein
VAFLGIGIYGKENIIKNIFIEASVLFGTGTATTRMYYTDSQGRDSSSNVSNSNYVFISSIVAEYRISEHLGVGTEFTYKHIFSSPYRKGLGIMGGIRIHITKSNNK